MSDEQPEVDDRHDSLIVEGDDVDHVFPPQELDPYTPEPDPEGRARTALWIALAVLVLGIVIVVIAAVR
jgi:hypothetical protein